ncbi:hypothetical protein RhiirA4_548303 [Rhizophagus irregularis]|uniref:Uncharacterized protein n=1 Tax=Rhizophagus irregularis TaxID=588596 RepID=A0A2I1H6Y6_9GLOM|nr:hypothetical protein RhiirA4_548303 [Rhizophagus irregularis]
MDFEFSYLRGTFCRNKTTFLSRQIKYTVKLTLYEIEVSNEFNEELLNQLKISNKLIGNIAVIGELSKHFDILISGIKKILDNSYNKMVIMDIDLLERIHQGVRDDETVTLAKFLENVDGGIMTSNMEIYPKFNEIIIKRSQISDSKKGENIHRCHESKFVACNRHDSARFDNELTMLQLLNNSDNIRII